MMQKLNFFSDDFIINEIVGESDYIKCPDRPKNIISSPNKNRITPNKKFYKRTLNFLKKFRKTLIFVLKSLIIFIVINVGGI